MRKSVKTWIKRAGLIISIPILLTTLMVVLLYLPFVQNFAARKVTQLISESVGMNLNVGYFRLAYPLNLTMYDIYLTDSNQDTIVFIKEINANLRLPQLLKKEISVSRYNLNEARIYSKSMIEGIEIIGTIGNLTGNANYISLTNEDIILNLLKLSDTSLTIRIDSILPQDSSEVTMNWNILLKEIQIDNLALSVLLPTDSMSLTTFFENISLSDGKIDLNKERYEAGQFRLTNSLLCFETENQPVKKGLDPSHILLSEINVAVDSILYHQNEIQALIRSFSANEQSSLAITSMTGKINMDDENIQIPYFTATTPFSSVSAQITVPRKALEMKPDDFLSARLAAVLAPKELELVVDDLAVMLAGLPSNNALKLSCWVEGNLKNLHLHELKSDWPGIFQIDANGIMKELMDSVSRSGTFDLTAVIQGKDVLKNVIPKQYAGRFSLPDTVWITMQASLQEGNYAADIVLQELQGKMTLSGTYNSFNEEYSVDIKADNIAPIHFLPEDSIWSLTATFQAEGKGTDVFSDKTWTQYAGVLAGMQYKDMYLSGISFDGSLKNNQIQSELSSILPYAKGNLSLSANLQKERLAGMLIMDMDTLDFQGMKLIDQPFANSFQVFSEFESDLQKRHQLDVTLGNWDMFLSGLTVSPKTLIIRGKADEDTTRLSLHAGDLGVIFTASADIVSIADKLAVITDDITKQLKKDSLINFQQLRPLYPQMNLRIEAQRDNPVYNYLQDNNTYFNHFYINASTSPDNGLKMDGLLHSFIKDTMRIDTIKFDVRQDTIGIKYAFDVIKNRFRRQEAYQAGLKGGLWVGGGDAEFTYRNERRETGFQVGLRAEKQPDGVTIQLFPENPILAFHPFQVNEDNYIHVRNLKDISANLRLEGEGNTLIWLHSEEEDGKMQELLTEINSIDLNRISTRFLEMPSIQGMTDMSMRYVPEEETFMIVGEAFVNNLIYEGGKIGDLLLSSVYLPLGMEEHQLDINFFHNQHEIAKITALYQPAKNDRIDGTFDINKMSLSTLNPFFADMAHLNGAFQSSMTISGTAKQPMLDGYIKTDTASIFVPAIGTRFRLEEKNVEIKNNTIQFDRYGIFAVGNNPLTVDGKIDLNVNNPVKSMVDLQMAANNMQLFDSRKTPDNIAFGRLFVDLRNFTAKGPFNSLVMRGNLNLLNNTNMTYIMKESPLTVQDRMANLITFTYFRDTIPRRRALDGTPVLNRESRPVEGMDVQMAIRAEPGARLTIELDESGDDRIELQGEGNLSLRYTPQGDMLLTGRYILSGGLIRYEMPIVSHKTLRIRENSYLDWSGDPFDPYLNLRAFERVRANVSTDGQSSRSVNFDAGIDLRQRLDNLSLQFTLEAVDDAAVQSRLQALGAEERSKRAIGLLLAGIYLDDDAAGKFKFDMGSALTGFLQSEINHITGDLLKGVDFNFGMSNDERMGVGATNYAFRFGKRFYNDRINVVVGGNVWTGNVPNDNNTFINDASIEYRLDPGGNRYAKLFYKRQYESLLEGEITKYGGGIVFRRKILRLGDLFLFRKR